MNIDYILPEAVFYRISQRNGVSEELLNKALAAAYRDLGDASSITVDLGEPVGLCSCVGEHEIEYGDIGEFIVRPGKQIMTRVTRNSAVPDSRVSMIFRKHVSKETHRVQCTLIDAYVGPKAPLEPTPNLIEPFLTESFDFWSKHALCHSLFPDAKIFRMSYEEIFAIYESNGHVIGEDDPVLTDYLA